MKKVLFFHKLALFTLAIVCAFFFSASTFGEYKEGDSLLKIAKLTEKKNIPKDEDFAVIKARSFSIYYEPTVDLKRVYTRLTRRRFYVSDRMKPRTLSNFGEKIVYRLNILLARVKETLDMYPPEMIFKINIFKNKEMVYNVYRKISGEKRKVKAFYVHRLKTIYTSEETISDSVIAHELAHVIIDNYFVIRPPVKVSEMMAIYADSHLD